MSLCAWLVTIAFLTIYWRYKAESLSVFVFPLVFVMTLVAALSKLRLKDIAHPCFASA